MRGALRQVETRWEDGGMRHVVSDELCGAEEVHSPRPLLVSRALVQPVGGLGEHLPSKASMVSGGHTRPVV